MAPLATVVAVTLKLPFSAALHGVQSVLVLLILLLFLHILVKLIHFLVVVLSLLSGPCLLPISS